LTLVFDYISEVCSLRAGAATALYLWTR